jgi:ribonuclease HI
MELLAAVEALRILSPEMCERISPDSNYVKNEILEWVAKWAAERLESG